MECKRSNVLQKGGRTIEKREEYHQIKSSLISQPGPAALTDGLAELQRIIVRMVKIKVMIIRAMNHAITAGVKPPHGRHVNRRRSFSACGLMLLLSPSPSAASAEVYFQSPEAKSVGPQNLERPALGCCLAPSIRPDFW